MLRNIPSPYLVLGIFILAFALRVYNLEIVPYPIGDEAMHIASARNYSERGYFGPDNWYHPPLKHILEYASLEVFGDSPSGWRMRNVIFGSATIAVLFLIAGQIVRNRAVALLSSLLLMLDPLHITFSRGTFEDIPATFFMLLGLYFGAVAPGDKRANLIVSGISLGLAISLRVYCASALLVVLGIRAFAPQRKSSAENFAWLLFLPVTVYVASFLPWFRRGYSLGEWLLMQRDAVTEMMKLKKESFIYMAGVAADLGSPPEWFVKFIAFAFRIGVEEGRELLVVYMNNPPVWMLILPAVAYMTYLGVRRREQCLLALAATFWAIYLPFLVTGRPLFLYSSIPLIPLGVLGIAVLADRYWHKAAKIALAGAVSWCIYLYPVSVGMNLPPTLYDALLNGITILR